ncbi:MAG: P-II family nitrogen regulator [Saprospiraceae bacterium]
MKEIKAFVRTTKAREVHKALKANGYCCMTLTECEGTGKYTDPEENFPSFKFPFMHSKVVKIEIVCRDAEVESIVKIIQESSKTGHPGDGIIYTVGVAQAYKVKNEQTGVEAIL